MKINDNVFAVVNKHNKIINSTGTPLLSSNKDVIENVIKEAGNCPEWSIASVTIVPTADLARLKACERVLREVEWSGDVLDQIQPYEVCPSCGRCNEIGHAIECKLALALSPAGSDYEEKT